MAQSIKAANKAVEAIRLLEGETVSVDISINIKNCIVNSDVTGKLQIYMDGSWAEDEMFVIKRGKNSTEFSLKCIKGIDKNGKIIVDLSDCKFKL